jgi:hypothetical protein
MGDNIDRRHPRVRYRYFLGGSKFTAPDEDMIRVEERVVGSGGGGAIKYKNLSPSDSALWTHNVGEREIL